MARNKHPEETVNLILDKAFDLFMEKGYEHTSIQDLLNNLGGLSKGAIYHHFKSKEDILEAVTDRMTEDITGREKLKMIFAESLKRPVQEEIFSAAPDLSRSPTLLFSMFRDTVDDVAPNYILPVIRDGIADGSIHTDYPEELAELIILGANVWMNPMVFGNSPEQILRKGMVFGQMLQGFGLDILDEEIIGRMQELTEIYQKNR